jgi:hypothetical protein
MMATVVNQIPPARYAQIPTWLRDLVFVTDFFSWLFALCSRLAEPLMLLCTLYIVAEAGVPAIAVPALHNLAIGIMICAPEIILPGSFVVAARAQEHARLLFTVCWIFVGLTLLTLISLFVWHFTGTSLAWLMCARCATAVGYSILMRVMAQGQQVIQGQVVQQKAVEEQIAALAEQVQRITHTLQSQPALPEMSLILAQVIEELDARYTQRMETMIERTVERVRVSIIQQSEQQYSGRARLSIVNGRSMEVNRLDTTGEIQMLPANTFLDTSDSNIGQQVRALLLEDSTLSARALAGRVGCSPTTASKWKSRIEAGTQA